jgi:hypothetical protein
MTDSLNSKHRRDMERLAKANRVLREIELGAALYLSLENGNPTWRLSSGRQVSDSVAKLVVASGSVEGAGDCLFRDMRSQTFRWWRDPHN